MKICFLADIRSIHTKRWIEYFASLYEIHLITLDFSPEEMANISVEDYVKLNVKIHTIPRSFPRVLLNSWRVRDLIKEIQPDLLHAHFVTHYGYWGAKAGFHPFIVSGWGDDVLIHPKNFLLRYFVNHALRVADLITCDGENTFSAIRNLGIPDEKIHLITHGVDTKKFTSQCRDSKLFEMIFGNTWPVVICIRGFNPIYDAETLIRAIPLVVKEEPQINFLISGKGYDEDRMKSLAQQLGVTTSVNFCGWIPHDQLPPYLASADVYVSVSLSDGGVAISTFEAMASGLAVVVTDTGDNPLWIKEKENGFVIPVRNPEQLADKIVYLVRHPKTREHFGAANRAIVETKQDYYKEMEKVHIVYKDLIMRLL